MTMENRCGSAGTAPHSSDGPISTHQNDTAWQKPCHHDNQWDVSTFPQNELTLHPPTTGKSTAVQKTEDTHLQNFCMHQWNEQQPGGQGLTADFDVYFKGLSDMDKVQFKKEMHTGTTQGAMHLMTNISSEECETAAKQPSKAPSVNQPYVGAHEQIPIPTPLPSHYSSQAPQPPDPSCLHLYCRLGQFYFYLLSFCIHTPATNLLVPSCLTYVAHWTLYA
ncbi:hypothetical protein EDB85DRAFT_1897356 [Lactarius pseudohatsudake]|nr:hypothetical protein EDB85DRAFT_1897356 [Lactarius pseudohatsudake]